MAPSGNKDPRLSEVKAVLQRLQRLPAENPGERPIADARSARRVSLVTGGIIFATAAGILGAALLIGFMQSSPGPQPGSQVGGGAEPSAGSVHQKAGPGRPVVDEAASRATLNDARDLMAKGRVRSARARLQELVAGGLPQADVAWALARSYDPNFLVTLPAPDADPDVREATRWYREWYAAAVRQGLVADSVSLERIIGSMKQ
jgi:hypothetical protein